MSTPYQRIEGHEQVLLAFGYWPEFHDAEVRSLCLDRNAVLCDAVADARMDVCLHAFEWTGDATPMFNHHLVQFRFHDIQDLDIEGFNHQNAILEFKIEGHTRQPDMSVGFKITFLPAHGLSGFFCASKAEVLSFTPCDEQGRPRRKAESAAAPESRPPRQLSTSPEPQSSDSQATSSSGSCE
jgi:hypothetical protein